MQYNARQCISVKPYAGLRTIGSVWSVKEDMSAPDAAIVTKLRKFVEELSDCVDLQFSADPSLPKLPVDPRDRSSTAGTAHYMLLVASIDQQELGGASENARKLLVSCH